MNVWQWLKRQWGGSPTQPADHAAAPLAPRPDVHSRDTAAPPPATEPKASRPPSVRAGKVPRLRSGKAAAAAARRRRPVVAALPADLLQFSSQPTGVPIDVVVGFDFGTSSAKVAMQTHYFGKRVVMIDFDALGHESCTYLLPACLYQCTATTYSLDAPRGAFEHRRHLKLGLLGEIRTGDDPDPDHGTTAWAVAFVAVALREARRRFLEGQAETYTGQPLRWAMNLGIPSAGYDDDKIQDRFLMVARAAWCASLRPAVNTKTVEAALVAVNEGSADDVPIAVVPEVVAEMVGYAKALLYRRPGLHVVFDIGASTLDICGIELFAMDGDDNYELLTTDVRDMGFLELHQRRMLAVEHRAPFDAVPADIVAPLTGLFGLPDELSEKLRRCDQKYVEDAAAVLLRTLTLLHRWRAPGSPAWRDGLPLFVTGGGTDSPLVKRIIQLAHERAKSVWVTYNKLKDQKLPMDVAVGPYGSDLQRMAVAYGLSFPAINIGTIKPPHEIPDVEPQPMVRRDWQHAYVDKDAV